MACNDPYQNPAGLKFVTRVEYLADDPQYRGALTRPQLMLNIPNGAGPGTLYLGTQDTYASWLITDVKNLVRQTQRAYTGASNWEQLWVEDGCTVQVLLLDRDSVNHYSPDGIAIPGNPEARIFAQWFPAGTEITSFDRLSLVSGPPGTANRYPFGTLAAGQASRQFVPVGLCRFVSISATDQVTVRIEHLTAATNPLYEIVGPTNNFTRAVPAWGVLQVIAGANTTADFAVCWNRYPMIGS